MKLIFGRSRLLRCAAAVLFALAAGSARAQAPAPAKPLLSDQAFKNVKVLKGIPVDEFMSTMGFFSSSLAENCLFCHVLESAGDWSKFAEDNDNKNTARRMIAMVNTINKNNFGGRRMVTCYSCHRGAGHPKVIPSLADTVLIPDSHHALPFDDAFRIRLAAEVRRFLLGERPS